MVTIIIPGYSAHNQKWLEDTAKDIRGDGEIRPIYWGHWTDPDVEFDPKVKANLLDGVSGKRVVDIVAKSIGTLVASYLIQKSPEKIKKVVFCGIPLNDMDENDKEIIKAAIRKIPLESILFIQNDEDPHGGTDALTGFLSEFGRDIKIISKQRADHEYFCESDFNEFFLG
jgi:pimeloyl-ACP methyl ester carboxylesterase